MKGVPSVHAAFGVHLHTYFLPLVFMRGEPSDPSDPSKTTDRPEMNSGIMGTMATRLRILRG